MDVIWCEISQFLQDEDAFRRLCRREGITPPGCLCHGDDVRHVAARLLVKRGWARQFGPLPMPPVVEMGKPHFSGRADVHFNLSHSGALVVCAWGSQPVGVDVEEIVPLSPFLLDILHPAERQWVEASIHPEQAFFQLWTAKESQLKLSGAGLTALPELESLVGEDGTLRSAAGGNQLLPLSLPVSGYVATLCVAKPEPVQLISISL